MSNVGARQVGEFTPPRPIIRTMKNPLDKATIVSIFPREINDIKETIQPREFHLDAGTKEDPSLTIITPAAWVRDSGDERPLEEVYISSTALAQSVIVDYCNGLLGCAIGDKQPGLFFINGEVTKKQVLSEYKIKLAEAEIKQNNWYHTLVMLADSLWARGNGNPLIIWDIQRLAARSLGLESKPWLKDFQLVEFIKCFACGTLKDPKYPICLGCKTIDVNHPLAKEIKTAL